MRRVVVIVVDRLGAGFLGPYGNTWLETPACNQLASESVLFENALTSSPRLDEVYRSYWRGDPIAGARAAGEPSLLERIVAAGGSATLVTDEPAVIEHADAAAFTHKVFVPTGAPTMVDDVSQSQIAKLFATAIEQWESQATSLLWIHARGMAGPWDAPREYRERFAEEGDPAPPELVDPPEYRLPLGFDPDLVLGVQQAYAGQVAAFDVCLESLLEALTGDPSIRETLIILTSPRGFPLGEHLRVGANDEALYSELVHIPLLLRWPDGSGATIREPSLVQPADLHVTLSSYLELPSQDTPAWGRDLHIDCAAWGETGRTMALVTCGSEVAIRTPAWFLRRTPDRPELYFKPDDRWEINEVSNRCEEIVGQLIDAGSQFQRAAQARDSNLLPALSEELVQGEG